MQKGSGLVNVGSVTSATAVIVNGDIIFTISGGPIAIVDLYSLCITTNDATPTLITYSSTPTVGTATAFSGAAASIASVNAGGAVRLQCTALSTAPLVIAHTSGGVSLGVVASSRIIVNAGTIKITSTGGSTTGTWRHHLAYIPMAPGVTVS